MPGDSINGHFSLNKIAKRIFELRVMFARMRNRDFAPTHIFYIDKLFITNFKRVLLEFVLEPIFLYNKLCNYNTSLEITTL
jgi:hypothetical protein